MNHSLTNTPTSNKPLRTILSWIIASILVIGVVFSFIDFKYVSTGGRILVLVSFLFGVIYSQVIKDLSKIERLFIFLMSFIQLIHFLFVINHWKGIFFTHLTLIIPIGLFVLITFRMNGKFKYEFPFLLVMATTALLSFIWTEIIIQLLTACISHCWQRVCKGLYFWLPCGNSTTKRFDDATAHTRGR